MTGWKEDPAIAKELDVDMAFTRDDHVLHAWGPGIHIGWTLVKNYSHRQRAIDFGLARLLTTPEVHGLMPPFEWADCLIDGGSVPDGLRDRTVLCSVLRAEQQGVTYL